MKICTIGVGMVGSQVASWFKDCLTYDTDPKKQSNTWEECSQADCFFVCVPSPYKEGEEYDLTILENAIDRIPDGKIVVIKSTVSPGTTDYFQSKYPNKTFLFNPEFLTELSAKEDFIHPDSQILGVPHQGYEIASQIMLMLPPAPVMRIISPIDAEWVKKIRNAYYSTKVVFFNQIFDIVQKTETADYETIRSILVEDPRIGNSHSFVFHKGYRGFSGPCLPKDFYSLMDFANKVGAKSELLEVIKKINKELTDGKDFSYGTSGLHRLPLVQSTQRERT